MGLGNITLVNSNLFHTPLIPCRSFLFTAGILFWVQPVS